MTRLPLLLLVVGSVLPVNASGQTIPSSYRFIENGQEAGVFVGSFSAATGLFDLGPKSGFLVGGRYVLEVGGPVFLEGLTSLLSTSRDVVDPRREEGDRSLGEADVQLFMFDARLALSLTGRRTWRGLSPYIFFGGGIAFDAAGRDPLEDLILAEDRFDFGTSFTASLGSGLRYSLSDGFMLRTDMGLTLWQLATPTGFDAPEKALGAVPENEWVGGLGFTVGISWRF